MDKQHFLEIAQRLSVHSESDAQEIVALKNQYRYSQVLHVLAAKIARDNHLATAEESLKDAAVYVTDRGLLKEIMETVPSVTASIPAVQEVFHSPEPVTVTVPDAAPVKSLEPGAPVLAVPTAQQGDDGHDIADDLMRDLKTLSELKHNFELLYSDQSSVSKIESTPAQLISESATTETTVAPAAVPTPVKRRAKKTAPQENIIEEIQISKQEIEPENERQKLQIDLIDNFIKTQPSISPVKERAPANHTDLNSIKSGEFSEQIVSETLVEILLKQGKKERAIEVLKKLIWKYPQKKAFFASQIDELRK